MANTPDKVIAVAKAEIGYLEKSNRAYRENPAILYEKVLGAGYDNYTKYGKEMHAVYPQVMDFPAAWCDAFVDWCFYKAYGVSTAKSLIGGGFNDYTVASAMMYQEKGALDINVRVGDQVFFTRDGGISGVYHTGIVTSVDSDYFHTVEGNTSSGRGVVANGGGVFEKKYMKQSFKGKVLFGHPAYDANVQPFVPTWGKTISKTPQYIAEVTASSLNVRSWAGVEYPQIKVWPVLAKGNWIDVCDFLEAQDGSTWAYVRIAGMYYGFVANKYLKRVM